VCTVSVWVSGLSRVLVTVEMMCSIVAVTWKFLQSESLLMFVGQPGGSLQAVKESLLQMRFQRDHISASSSTSVAANASSSVRSLPTQSAQQDDSSGVMCIANELIRYMLDDEDLTSSLIIGDKTTLSSREAVTSSDPCVVNVALQHQQLRAEVLNCHMLTYFLVGYVILRLVTIEKLYS